MPAFDIIGPSVRRRETCKRYTHERQGCTALVGEDRERRTRGQRDGAVTGNSRKKSSRTINYTRLVDITNYIGRWKRTYNRYVSDGIPTNNITIGVCVSFNANDTIDLKSMLELEFRWLLNWSYCVEMVRRQITCSWYRCVWFLNNTDRFKRVKDMR